MSRSGRRSAPTRSRSPTTGRRPSTTPQAPAVRVAENGGGDRSHGWIGRGEIIEGTGKRLPPGDVLVLVRKRDRFVHALSRSLKEPRHSGRRRRPAEPARPYRGQGSDRARPFPASSRRTICRSPRCCAARSSALSEETLFELAAERPARQSLVASLRQHAGRAILRWPLSSPSSTPGRTRRRSGRCSNSMPACSAATACARR